MADTDVIRSFLVQLGFQVNNSQLNKFNSAVAGTIKPVVALGTAVAATTVAIEAMVLKVAENLEKLYFAGQRSQTTVSNLRSIQYAMRGIGLAADAGQSAIEGLARSMRSNPGIIALLNQMGIATKGRDTAAIYNDLLDRLGQMPFYLAQQYAQLFGVDPETLRAMLANRQKMVEAIEDNKRRMREAGIDIDDLARRSHEMMNVWRLLADNVDILATKIADKLMPAAQRVLEWANAFVVALTNVDKAIGAEFSSEIDSAVNALLRLQMAFDELWEQLKPFFDAFISQYIPFVKEMAHAIADVLSVSIETLTLNLKALTALLKGDSTEAWSKFLEAARNALNAAMRLAQPFINLWDRVFGKPAQAPGSAPAPSSAPSNDNSGSLPLGLRQNNPGNLRWWSGMDRKNGFAAFPTMQAGLSAMAQQLILYGKRGINTLESIVGRYAPAFENNVKAYVGYLEKTTGFKANQALDLQNHETLAKVMKGMIGMEQGRQPFSDDEINAAVNSRLGIPSVALGSGRGGGNVVNMSQRTEIHVNGSGSADAVGRAVAAEQGRVNGDLQRNLEGAVQ